MYGKEIGAEAEEGVPGEQVLCQGELPCPAKPPSCLGKVKTPPAALCTLPADFRARLMALLRSLSNVTH